MTPLAFLDLPLGSFQWTISSVASFTEKFWSFPQLGQSRH